jgi:hypothetical protein
MASATAHFIADFSKFTDAVKKAEIALKGFEDDANKVGKSLNRMGDQFSGRRVIQDAQLMARAVDEIGGASKLTQAELKRVGATAQEAVAKMKALGIDVPPEIRKLTGDIAKLEAQTKGSERSFATFGAGAKALSGVLGGLGVGLSVGAVASFTKGLFDMAGQIKDLSTATGVSTDALQEFAYVGSGVGVSMDEIGRAVGTLSERLAGGDRGAAEAVQKLGLNMADLLAAGPRDAFIAIGDAVGQLADPMEKNAVAADLFGGKLSRQLIPLLGDLRTAMQNVPKNAVITQEQIDNADKFGDKIDELLITWKAWAATRVIPTQSLDLFMPPNATLEEKAELLRKAGVASNWAAEQIARNAAQEKAKVDAAAAAQKAHADALNGFIGPLMDANAEQRIYADLLKKQEAALQRAAAAAGKAAEEQRLFADNLRYVTERSQGLAAALETLDGRVVEGIRYYTSRGVALDKLVKMYGLTTLQSEAMESRLRIEALMAEAASKSYGKLATEVYNVATAQGALTSRPLPNLPKLQAGANPAITAATSGDSWSNLFDGVPEIMAQAMAASGKIENALRAAMAKIGAQIGKMIGSMFGEIGGKIGEQLGSMVGYVAEKMWDAFTTSKGEDVARRIGRNWGIRISEEMGDQIAKDAAEMFNGSRQAAELWNMRDIFAKDPNNLGITKRNVDQAAARLRDVFSMIETHQMTIAQGAKVIDDVWSDLVAAGTDSFGFINDQLREIIALDRRFGTESKEVAKFLKEQGEVAVKASNDVIASIAPMVAEWRRLKDAGVSLGLVAQRNKQQLEDLGIVALSTFAAAVAAGKSFAEAVELAGPGLTQLSDAFKVLGIDTDNAALKVLMLQGVILQNNPALIKGVGSLGAAFAALSNMGALNTETFGAMTRTGMQMYSRLQAEVAAVGGTTKDALLPMQDYLHKAQKAAEELGIPLDENTQMLIDQSKELGIWKEAGKTANEKMLEGIGALIAKMDEFITRITAGLYPAIENIPNPEIEGRVTWDVDNPPIANMPSVDRFATDVVPMASGGMGTVTKPTLFLAGEAGREDFAFSGANKSFGSGSTGGTTEVHVHIGDRQLGSFVLEDIASGGKTFSKFGALVKAVA